MREEEIHVRQRVRGMKIKRKGDRVMRGREIE
jgi:hypothetical protein